VAHAQRAAVHSRSHRGGRSTATRPRRDEDSALIRLQRLAGNRAVAGVLAPRVVQRACCGGCASGGSCESEVDEAPRPSAPPAVQRYKTEDCGPYDVAQRRGGVRIAIDEASRAVAALQRYLNVKPAAQDPATTRLLRENFASSSSSTALKALIRFTKIKHYLLADDFTIECESECDDAKAYVYAVWSDLHMCMDVLQHDSTRRYGEILLHEVSHDAAGTDDEEYYYPSRTTTTLSVSDALDNADSYESFAAQI
jgi:hypothetical protein